MTPGLVVRQKWHERTRNLIPGDLVMICDNTKVKAKYRLGVIQSVKKSTDGVIRTATVRYSIVERGGTLGDCGVVTSVRVKRSVQRLSMIMPVEEQESTLSVEENDLVVNVLNADNK